MGRFVRTQYARKGFTLVEILVVLVVLALLAGLLVPSLIGYIGKANDKKLDTEARRLLVALQTVVSEQYAYGRISGTALYASTDADRSMYDALTAEALYLAEAGNAASVDQIRLERGRVVAFVYRNGSRTFTYSDAAQDTTPTLPPETTEAPGTEIMAEAARLAAALPGICAPYFFYAEDSVLFIDDSQMFYAELCQLLPELGTTLCDILFIEGVLSYFALQMGADIVIYEDGAYTLNP